MILSIKKSIKIKNKLHIYSSFQIYNENVIYKIKPIADIYDNIFNQW